MALSDVRKEVLALPLYHIPIEKGGVKLNQNESPFDVPAEVKMKVVERLLAADWNRYGESQPSMLKKQLAHSLSLRPENIVVANGSNVLIQALLLAFSVSGTVLTPAPTFSVYGLESRLLSNRLVEVPLNPDFSLDVDAFLRAIELESPRIIFIANPNAPTGNLFKKSELLEIVKAARCPVVIDEAYYPFSELTLIGELKRFPNLIVMRTFSKAFAMAGVRLGYLAAAQGFAREVSKVLLPFCLSILSQMTAEVVLENPRFVQGYVDKIVKERAKLYEKMRKIARLDVFPSHGNFILFRVSDAKRVFALLLSEGVLVRDVSDGGFLSNCLRVSVGTALENAAFLKALYKVLS